LQLEVTEPPHVPFLFVVINFNVEDFFERLLLKVKGLFIEIKNLKKFIFGK